MWSHRWLNLSLIAELENKNMINRIDQVMGWIGKEINSRGTILPNVSSMAENDFNRSFISMPASQ
jgi:hypothetical protein